MGFDIECIIDIHTYPGEYFCPVCRTLVYPSEAFQSQCTHLYCKPCLAHIANGSRACPYDGYLVTESDSKPLMDSNKALAENIGKVKVHCLYFRSGCSWEGTLSDCSSHCAGCSFGNSPVICNRCGIQIVHRQVHDHAQSCPGGMDSFNQSRKRKPVSTGWCRICEVDCETVEGLDMHSQTREHQKMAMDMVKTIKLQNNKKQRNAAGHMVHEGGSRSRKVGIVGRGVKP
ncbi:UNVERIFIED_CONTAM: hypothetical protein Scaly_2540200 [Sesamum calycinum]|uniref:RING-type domain-containing protein n=1 Tax=Sesamum calycinum TaxID=2727403 RepID=A0AAW2JLG8_9LAMI